jgi:hypothetical protein
LDKPHWIDRVEAEHGRFKKHIAFKAVQRGSLPLANKILMSTYAMKKKASGIFRASLNAQRYEQLPDRHYDQNLIAAL